ncbi:NAD(P)-binding protein [Aureobasidium subglaciale]|nr:NAD(P)-binding protein [Aureobasidium subglaciale]
MAPTLFPGVALITGASSGKHFIHAHLLLSHNPNFLDPKYHNSNIHDPNSKKDHQSHTLRNTGIGKATATSFAQEGCPHIVLADISTPSLQETHTSLTSLYPTTTFLAIQTDISSPSSVRDLFRKTLREFHRVDYAVNCAGVLGTAKKSHEMTLEEFDHVVNVDYRGSWLCSREELKCMVGQEPLETHDGRQGNRGVIVNVASQLGIVARPQAHTEEIVAAYCSAKAAIIGLTKSDALDYSAHNIRVNCVCPGVIETPLINDKVRKAISIAPMNRAGTPQEIADCILFLCSPKASFVQGAALVADGGYTIN